MGETDIPKVGAIEAILRMQAACLSPARLLWQAQLEAAAEAQKFSAACARRHSDAARSIMHTSSEFLSWRSGNSNASLEAVSHVQVETLQCMRDDVRDLTEMTGRCARILAASSTGRDTAETKETEFAAETTDSARSNGEDKADPAADQVHAA